MYTIRQANIEDVPSLVALGEKFYKYSNFSNFVDYDPDSALRTLAHLILHGFLFVAEHDEEGVIGGFAGTMTNLWFNHGTPVASEMAWWVEEKYRKSPVAIRLYKAFEKWAKERGVKVITMSDLIIDGQPPADKLFKKMGFSVVERAHIKRE